MRPAFASGLFALLAGCAMPPGMMSFSDQNAPLVQGPAIEDIVTPFDAALACLDGRIMPGITFAVGQVVDATGKETYAEGGTGRFITQGAGEMVQSALFRAGLAVVNRRDPTISVTETQWGIRDLQEQVPVNFYITGSINSLDFIPGGGFSATLAGAGPRYRQNRILIGLDLSMTDAFTGRIVANVPLQKQIFSRELGASLGRYFGDTLVSLDVGGQEREAVHFALRQMINLATFQLLGQLLDEADFAPCSEMVSPMFGTVTEVSAGDPDVLARAAASSEELAELRAALRGEQTAAAPQPAPAPQDNAAAAQAAVQEQLRELTTQTSIFAARSIAASEESLAAQSRDVAAQKAAEAMQLMAASVQLLQRAAELGLTGPEGDAVAVVVERAIQLAQQANAAATAGTAPPAQPAPGAGTGPVVPGTRDEALAPAGTSGSEADARPAPQAAPLPAADEPVSLARIDFYLRLIEAAVSEALATDDPQVVALKARQAARFLGQARGLLEQAAAAGLAGAEANRLAQALQAATQRVALAQVAAQRVQAAAPAAAAEE